MALKKSDLYSSLWKSCDELRGGMDASQYKDYILTLLFVKSVSDKAKADPNSLIDVPKGGSFDDMLAAKGDKEIGDRINKIIAALAEANGLQTQVRIYEAAPELPTGVDVLVANILSGPLRELAPTFGSLVREGGAIVLAGLLENQAADVTDAYTPWFDIHSFEVREGWSGLAGKRKSHAQRG